MSDDNAKNSSRTTNIWKKTSKQQTADEIPAQYDFEPPQSSEYIFFHRFVHPHADHHEIFPQTIEQIGWGAEATDENLTFEELSNLFSEKKQKEPSREALVNRKISSPRNHSILSPKCRCVIEHSTNNKRLCGKILMPVRYSASDTKIIHVIACMLGDAGSGKTIYCAELAYSLHNGALAEKFGCYCRIYISKEYLDDIAKPLGKKGKLPKRTVDLTDNPPISFEFNKKSPAINTPNLYLVDLPGEGFGQHGLSVELSSNKRTDKGLERQGFEQQGFERQGFDAPQSPTERTDMRILLKYTGYYMFMYDLQHGMPGVAVKKSDVSMVQRELFELFHKACTAEGDDMALQDILDGVEGILYPINHKKPIFQPQPSWVLASLTELQISSIASRIYEKIYRSLRKLIDKTTEMKLRDLIRKCKNELENAIDAQSPMNLLQTNTGFIQRNFLSGDSKKKISHPLAVTGIKADLLPDETMQEWKNMLKNDAPGVDASKDDLKKYLYNLSDLGRRMFINMGASAFVNFAEDNYNTVGYFFTSSLGRSTNFKVEKFKNQQGIDELTLRSYVSDNNGSRMPEPFGMIEPLLWLLLCTGD